MATLSDDATATPSFVPDFEGVYEVTLTVNDHIGPGAPDTIGITATTAAGFAEPQIVSASDVIEVLTADQVATEGNQNALHNFLSQAIIAIQAGDLVTAIDKLQKAQVRTDGCLMRGLPDGNGSGKDWITDCDAQIDLDAFLSDALDTLEPQHSDARSGLPDGTEYRSPESACGELCGVN